MLFLILPDHMVSREAEQPCGAVTLWNCIPELLGCIQSWDIAYLEV
jgi:hypothetical protein